jgi:hypothetical protein
LEKGDMMRVGHRESLEELTGERWQVPGDDASRLIRYAHAAYVKPAEELTAEGLRLLIGRRVALDWTVPFAIDDCSAVWVEAAWTAVCMPPWGSEPKSISSPRGH